MLLELKQPESALAEYEKSMKIDPNRFNGLAGAAHAAAMAHQPEKANTYYAQLLKNCDDGKHSDRPELRARKPKWRKTESKVESLRASLAVSLAPQNRRCEK